MFSKELGGAPMEPRICRVRIGANAGKVPADRTRRLTPSVQVRTCSCLDASPQSGLLITRPDVCLAGQFVYNSN